MKTSHCPVCASGELALLYASDDIQYKGKTLSVEVEYAVCTYCGEEMILPEQIKSNDCRMRDAWRKADGFLTGEEIVALRKELGLTQQQAAQLFGGGANAFSKYERGEVIQSSAMDKLMRLALEKQPINVSQWLYDRAGLQKPEPEYSKVIPIIFKPKRSSIPSNITDLAEDFKEANYG
jgi:putative zinc finger/helix-turn-helix YgiT family protein